MKIPRLLLVLALGLSACAPQALYFHESTKVAFTADYNTSDTQPLATTFGYKRRIVAVVPAQERDLPAGGGERKATNREEALSLISKFSVRAGAKEGIVITNNFASGMAARMITDEGRTGTAAAVAALMHSAPVAVDAGGRTDDGRTAAQVAAERTRAVMGKFVEEDVFPPTKSKFKKQPDGSRKVEPREEKLPDHRTDDASGTPDLDKPAATRIAKDAAGHPLIENGKPVMEARQPDGTWKRVSP